MNIASTFFLDSCLNWGFYCYEETHGHSNSHEGKLVIAAGFQFRVLAHYCHVRKHDSVQADLVLETEMRVIHPDLQAAGGERGQTDRQTDGKDLSVFSIFHALLPGHPHHRGD